MTENKFTFYQFPASSFNLVQNDSNIVVGDKLRDGKRDYITENSNQILI